MRGLRDNSPAKSTGLPRTILKKPCFSFLSLTSSLLLCTLLPISLDMVVLMTGFIGGDVSKNISLSVRPLLLSGDTDVGMSGVGLDFCKVKRKAWLVFKGILSL